MIKLTRHLINWSKNTGQRIDRLPLIIGRGPCYSLESGKSNFSTISPDQVTFYNNAGFDWWSGVSMKPLRALNQLRVPLIRDTLTKGKPLETSKPLQGYTCIDVGCGGGLLCEPLARLGASVIGLDPSSGSIQAAEEHRDWFSPGLSSNLNYINTSIEDFTSDTSNHGKFDSVIASEVLEHVEDIDLFIKSCGHLIKPGGNLIITTINQTLAAYIVDILIAEKVLGLIPEGTHQYQLFITPTSLQRLIEHNEFTVRSVQGMIYNPISSRWSWSKFTGNNYSMVAIKDPKKNNQP
ncbi:ubiquinone biosynthesis O-methyltransferase, mitochondrial-like [Panonychus citri]|uniref:ubiquinone biosynthesis O-methyltransferase, mitochondrial-like n=1 Tax=Panonychus citri TaxID=50023 RepID=UPI002307D69E|nr:ubiquinone biosynthesis O-methyltransferase, mitochondrial-like [Panonychus citri]